jgi:hypothetical protein
MAGRRRARNPRSPLQLSDDDVLDILELAKLPGGGGGCGEAAIAINEVLLGGKGEYVAAANGFLWKRKGVFAGHVGVLLGSNLYDAEGLWDGVYDAFPPEFEAWGQLDPHDADWDFGKEEDAYGVIILRNLPATAVRAMLGEGAAHTNKCPWLRPELEKALRKWRSGVRP